MKSPWWTAC